MSHTRGVTADAFPVPARDDAWARSYAAGLAPTVDARTEVGWVTGSDRSRVALVGDVVLKLHEPGTVRADLGARLAAVQEPALAACFVQPLTPSLSDGPGGRLVTAWPRLPVLSPGDEPLPWADAGGLLARLHRSRPVSDLPPHGGPARLERAVARAARIAGDVAAPDPVRRHARLLGDLGRRLWREVRDAAERHTPAAGRASVLHGDWHLGQLARSADGWRLIDVDDVGHGDPAWDLGRPAGFWAAGLLPDEDWATFLGAYRDAAGPAVPVVGDPWGALDLPARCAVLVAAVRTCLVQRAHSRDSGPALLEACRRM